MRHIDFDPNKLTGADAVWWKKWSDRADTATDDLIKKWEKDGKLSSDDFDSAIWGDLKAWLLEHVFGGNCAYCETKLKQARQPGHAEHFRPKGAVRVKVAVNEKKSKLADAETLDPTGQKVTHPGYFWLAYCWENLLPSCNDCNTGQGKNNLFPVANGHILLKAAKPADVGGYRSRYVASVKWAGFYYLGPRELEAAEKRLLLNPYLDEPRDHLTFGVAGIEAARMIDGQLSPWGQHSIEVYELYASGLRRARQDQQMVAFNQYSTARNAAINGLKSPAEAHKVGLDAIRTYFGGATPPYSVAIDDFLKLYGHG
jgi:hypothetical protein